MDHKIFVALTMEDYLDELISIAEEKNQTEYTVIKDLAKTTEGETVIRYQFDDPLYYAVRDVIAKRDKEP